MQQSQSKQAVVPVIEPVFVSDHWLNIARRCFSANHNERPKQEISLLVIHNISLPPKQYGGGYVEDFFCNKLAVDAHPYFTEIANLQVSSHLYIKRDGSVVQFVPFNLRAWHAGMSCYGGRENCNDFSIGIELEGCDDHPYESEQYEMLAQVIKALKAAYPAITADRITGHEFIAPVRKTDPGPAFKWQRLFASLN